MDKYLFSLDRVEGDIVILIGKNRERLEVSTEKFSPADIKEGNMFEEVNGRYMLASSETEERKKIIAEKRNRLFNKSKKAGK